ncbi:hypothetical protein fugu_019417 [Takifugu bimaculatus]|uniref:Myosin tail domain-containing protein n=1 Tax=Takifugu bimaculatus TaxID=433685 RepID=A0A4Z2BJF0_9TELE|nr:hypothetical protein fugu_019417 [Takifugu bimaculatus]
MQLKRSLCVCDVTSQVRCRCRPGHAHKANCQPEFAACQWQQRSDSRLVNLSNDSRRPAMTVVSRGYQRDTGAVPDSLNHLQQLIEANVCLLQSSFTEKDTEGISGGGGLWSFAVLSQQLTFHLQQLHRQTEQELSNIQLQLLQIEGQRQQLRTDLVDLQQKKKQREEELKTPRSLQESAIQLCSCRQLQASIGERLLQSERLVFQQEALSSLYSLLSQDLQRYQEETQRLTCFTQRILTAPHRWDQEEPCRPTGCSMQEKTEAEQGSNMDNMHPPEPSPSQTPSNHSNQTSSQTWRLEQKKPPVGLPRGPSLHRAGSIKDLISRFSSVDQKFYTGSLSFSRRGRLQKSASIEVLHFPGQETGSAALSSTKPVQSPVLDEVESLKLKEIKSLLPSPTITTLQDTSSKKTEPAEKTTKATQAEQNSDQTDSKAAHMTQTSDSGSDSVADSGMGSESEMDLNKQPDSLSEEDPSTPRIVSTSQNPKYQLFLGNDIKTNGESGKDADGPGGGESLRENGPKLARWETTRVGLNHYRGSLESLASRDLDANSDRVGVGDSFPRVFNSPYSANASLDYNPIHRMSEYRLQSGMSPATSEVNLFTRSTSPVGVPVPTMAASRTRFSTYESMLRRRAELNNPMPPTLNTHYSMRSATLGGLNKKDYIEELTKQLDVCQKRNQFLEAESVEMEKERNQIRLEMRSLLVNNEDLLRTNTQLTNEMRKMREQMIEMERANQSMGEKFRAMEIEVKEARNVMVEANNQEYAFNYLQQSLNNKIQDAEESLDKQAQYAQTLSEKLWLAERQLEELQIDKETKEKKSSELQSTILKLETELAEALQVSSQAQAELSLQQKLREDSELRLEEMEESLLEKEQELQRQQSLISRLQGEVSGKLIDKEQILEEEIQLRERIQLQCKQAERMVEDLKMELHTTNQAKDELAKQVKVTQEKMLDMESDLEELHDSEQRWAAKHKRAIEQTEQLQMKLIQEKDQNDHLEIEKATLERQLRELRLEVEDLHNSRVQEDVISRAETRVKELENTLRLEERNKAILNNTITKLERRINEINDQMEEEHRIANEQKDLMTQRIRSLKRQLNEAEEESSRKEAQSRHSQRELAEERETNARLQRQLLEQHLQTKRKETLTIRQTLDNLRLDLSVDEEDEDQTHQPEETITKV